MKSLKKIRSLTKAPFRGLGVLLFLISVVSVSAIIKPHRVESVPFEMVGGYVIITVRINDSSPLNLILDTGVRNTIITELQTGDHITLNYSDVKDLMGLGGGNHLDAYISNYNVINVGRLKMDYKTVYVLQDNVFNLSKHTGTKINGLLGADFLQDYTIEIDYSNKRVRFFEPTLFDTPKGYEVLPIKIEAQKLFINLNILNSDSTRRQVKMLIDTGAELNAWFHAADTSNVKLPTKWIQGTIGEGLNGIISGKYGRIPELNFGGFTLRKPIVSFPDSASVSQIMTNSKRDGTIGSLLLSRFNLIFDYNNKKLYFKPNHTFNNKYTYNVAGIEIVQISEFLPVTEVLTVWENSPAAKAGVRPGDQIKEINGESAFKMTIGEVRKIFETPSNRPLNLLLVRSDKEIMVSIDVKDKI
ncbi:MAG: aspartyl protease family protein [Paludibacter sp.]